MKIRILFIIALLISTTVYSHRGDDEEHQEMSDPDRVERAIMESRRLQQNRTPETQLCNQVRECLIQKQQNLSGFVEGSTQVVQLLARLTNEPAVRANVETLNDMLSECQNIPTSQAVNDLVTKIDNTHWIHGSQNCNENTDPEIQVEPMGLGLTIMRQNKCQTAEGPFVYMIESEDKVLLVDTGDIRPGTELYEQARRIAGDREIVVTHTHAHGDHTGGDSSFRNKPNCDLMEPGLTSTQQRFGIQDWPNEIGSFDMGDRQLSIIPVPGHEGSSVAIYDPKSKTMLTGDIMYPGRLYINNYPEFSLSLKRMQDFAKENEVAAYLGGHVEMSSTPGRDIPFGRHAPNERSLVLRNSDLNELYDAAVDNQTNPQRQVLDSFIISP